MNAKDRKLLNDAQTAVAIAGGLVAFGLLPRRWKRSLEVAAVALVLVALLSD